jgi:hypothetical protein
MLVLCAGTSMAQQGLPARIVNPGPGVNRQSLGARIFNPNVAMVFDSSGKLIYFPPAVARTRKNICFETIVPARFIYEQIARFRDSLRATYDFFMNDEKKIASYYCFFKDDKKKDTFTVQFTDSSGAQQKRKVTGDRTFLDYLNELDAAIKLLDAYALKGNATAAEIHADFGRFKHFPAENFMKKLFFEQYEVQVKNGNDSVKFIKLNSSFNSSDKCFHFSADCNKLKDLACGNCGIPDAEQLSVQLVRTDPFTQTLKEWFIRQNDSLGSNPDTAAIANTLRAIATLQPDDPTLRNKLLGLDKARLWFLDWFWYTRGEFVIDPFQVMNDRGVKVLQATIKQSERDIILLRQQKTFLDSVLSKLPFKLDTFMLFKMVQLRAQIIADSINLLTDKKNAAEKALSAKSPLFPATQSKSFLNNASLVLSETKQVRPQIQFNAARQYRPVVYTKRQAHRVSELPDNEQGYLMMHNLDTATQFKFDQERKPFKDDEEFTQLIAEQIDKILNAGVTSGLLANAEQFFEELFPAARRGGALKGITPSDMGKAFITSCSDVDSVPVFGRLIRLGQAFVQNKLTMHYKSTVFTKEDPKIPRFRTHTEMIKFNTDSPFKDSVSAVQTVGGKTTQAFATNVNVGKLRYVQIAFGIAVTSNPINTTSIDTAGAGFRVSTTDNRAKAIAGFKIYPFQSYQRDRWLLPRYPLHRFSVFGGFEVLHPLDNFYVGGAYDIVPGLAFSAGKNIYLQTSRKIENNTVTETNRSYQQAKGLYYSVTVNPVLFVKFTTLFFKSL